MLSRASEYFHHALDADPAFGGLGRNPAHPDAGAQWLADRPHYMGDLAEVIPFGWKRPRIAQTGIGRQVTLWETALSWAGQECNAGFSVLAMLHSINEDVAAAHGRPVMEPHVLADIAQRVERYRTGWMLQGWHKPAWIGRQRKRGSAGGKAKAGKPYNGPKQQSATADMTDIELAAKLDVTDRTIRRWKRTGITAQKLAEPTNAELAKAAGVTERTIRNWKRMGQTGRIAALAKEFPKMSDLANTVNAPGCAQKMSTDRALPVDKMAAEGRRDAAPQKNLLAPTDWTDAETNRFWQDRAARIEAGRKAKRKRPGETC